MKKKHLATSTGYMYVDSECRTSYGNNMTSFRDVLGLCARSDLSNQLYQATMVSTITFAGGTRPQIIQFTEMDNQRTFK